MTTRLLTFPAWFSFSLTFSCDGHHLYTANSEGTVIAWCRRDQQRMKLPMFYSFLSSYAAGWLPRRRGLVTRTERTLWATPLTQERGGASMHKAPPMTITVSAPWYVTGTHGTVCCATSYCHWRADLGGREAERTQAFPPPCHFFSLSLFVLCFVRLVCLILKAATVWSAQTKRLKACFSFLHHVPRLAHTAAVLRIETLLFSIRTLPSAFVIHAGCFRRAAEWMCARNALFKLDIFILKQGWKPHLNVRYKMHWMSKVVVRQNRADIYCFYSNSSTQTAQMPENKRIKFILIH